MADYKVTAGQLASIANAIRLKGGASAALEYPSDWIDAIENLTPSSGGSEITPADPTIEYKVTDTDLTAIADAIRERGGTSESLAFPTDFVSAIENISGGGVEIVPWSTGTDEQIVAMIQAAHNGDIDLQTDGGWAVGDVRTINISAFTAGGNVAVSQQDIDIVITSFAEYENCGNVMQFDFKDALAQAVRLHSYDIFDNYGSSEMKTVTLPALAEALPTWLKESLIEFNCKYVKRHNDYTLYVASNNKLALRSFCEVLPYKGDYVATQDGTRLGYYTTTDNQKKKLGHNGSMSDWYVRTPYRGNNYDWDKISSSGGYTRGSGNDANGVAPFGCL